MHPPAENPGPPDWGEQQIVHGIAARRSEARAALVTASHDAVFSFACRLSPDEDLRRDWTHDCLLRIISDIETGAFKYRHPGGFWSWFRKRSWFLMLEARRVDRRRKNRETLMGDFPIDSPATSSPHHDLERTEIVQAVEDCIDGIEKKKQRHALQLLLMRDYSYRETAETMDSPLNSVRTWIRLGRLALRRCLRRRLGMETSEE